MATSFAELQFEPHRTGEGVSAKAFYPNGYGVSVVRFTIGGMSGSYGSGEGLYELAVLAGHPGNWSISYDTPITDDVVGYLTPEDATDLMVRVAALPSAQVAA